MKVEEHTLYGLTPDIDIILMHSRKKASKYLRRMGEPDYLSESPGHFVSLSGGGKIKYLVVVELKEGTTLGQEVGLISHEATHAMQQYFIDICEASPGIESQAYVVQAITQHLFELHIRWREKHRGLPGGDGA